MARVLAVYGTAYGQTERIVHRIARTLTESGHDVSARRGDDLPPDWSLEQYDAVLVGASVIRERHQPYMQAFVKRHAARLNAVPSAFISVCGAAAGASQAERDQAQTYVDAFLGSTGWRPRVARTFAGAIAYTRYGLLTRWIMRAIAKRKGGPTDVSRDHEFTDWNAVDRFAHELSDAFAPKAAGAAPVGAGRWGAGAVLAVLLALAAAGAAAQSVGEIVQKRGTITEDLYLAGGTVDVRGDVRGDVVAAGGQIVIEQVVRGDILAAGGTVDVPAEVLDDLRAAGGLVTLRGRIAGDAVAAGGTVTLGPDATVGGRAWLAGGTLTVAGHVGTHLKAGGGTIVISGAVDGNADLVGEQIEIGPTATIAGVLTYRSPREARIDPAATIGGGVTRLPMEGPSPAARTAGWILWLAVAGVVGAVLLLAFPGFATATVRTVHDQPWKAAGFGAIALVGGPLAAVLLCVTVLGAGLGVLVAVVYGLALVGGYLAGALVAGTLIVRLLGGGSPATLGRWIGTLFVGLVVLGVAGLVPVLGFLACLAALLVGLGAVVLRARDGWRAWRAASGALTAAA